MINKTEPVEPGAPASPSLDGRSPSEVDINVRAVVSEMEHRHGEGGSGKQFSQRFVPLLYFWIIAKIIWLAIKQTEPHKVNTFKTCGLAG